MTTRDEILELLTTARAERSAERSKQLLEAAIHACENWEQCGGGVQATIIRSQAFAELAVEETLPQTRTAQWKKALNVLETQWNVSPTPEIGEMYGFLAVDCFQDMLSSLELGDRQKILRRGRKYLDNSIDQTTNSQMLASLLARKSSVLRHLSICEFTSDARLRLLEESLRCANRAVEESKEAATLLELGLSEWALSRYELTDEGYVSRLRRAEKYLRDKMMETFEPAQIALSRFYRLTFQPLEACETFPHSVGRTRNVRRLLRECYIYAEGAIQLWYADYPQTVVEHHLLEAGALLEAAIAAGYQNARLIIDLAYVRAILEGPEAGNTALGDICTEQRGIAWDRALSLVAAEAKQSDMLSRGFALGIDDSAVWTLLGTFTFKFLNNDTLAEALYRAAVRLNPHNPIALTNLARFLVRKGEPSSLQEARRRLQQAQAFADRRFRWWRAVLAELEEKQVQRSVERPPAIQREEVPTRPPHFQTLKQIKSRFRVVEKLSDKQRRGYELQRLIFDLADLTFGTAAPSYLIQRAEGSISQIDAYFEHRGEKYRVECKWEKKPADHNDLAIFWDKLDVVGVSGLFVSMEGFTPAAIGRAREYRGTKAILLVDESEVVAVVNGWLNFDQLMTMKRLRFDQHSEPYYPVISAPEVELVE